MVVRARPVEERRTTAIEALHAFATLPDWLSAPADPGRVASALSRRIPELASGKLSLERCEVRGVQIRRNSLPAHYRLEVTAEDGLSARTVDLRGELVPPGRPGRANAPGAPPLGSAAWRCWVPEMRLDLTTELPGDPALPALQSLTHAEKARALLERVIRAGTPRYADLQIEACSPRVAKYRAGSRCTIAYRLSYRLGTSSSKWPETVVAKTRRRGRVRNEYECMRELWSSRLRNSRNVTIAEPLGFLPDLNVLVQAGIRHDRTLEELLRSALETSGPEATDGLVAFLGKTARGLADLHACQARPLQILTWEDRLADIHALLARLGTLVPELTEAATPLLGRLQTLAHECPADSLRPAHRSFRPAQVLLQGGEIAFVDFDRSCRAEPALDVALFRAVVKDIGLRALHAKERKTADEPPHQDHLSQLDELCQGFSMCYEAEAPVSRRRVALWEALELFTLVLHSWTKVQSDRLRPRLALLRHHLRASGLAE